MGPRDHAVRVNKPRVNHAVTMRYRMSKFVKPSHKNCKIKYINSLFGKLQPSFHFSNFFRQEYLL